MIPDMLSGVDVWLAIAAKAAGAYVVTVAMMRSTGARALASFNIFDLIVTVALGSLIASIVLSENVSVIDGAVGIAVLVLAKYGTALAARRFDWVRAMVKAEPRALLVDGEMLHDVLAETQISDGELRMAIRSAGYADMEEVGAVILEPNGTLSVLPVSHGSALDGIRGIPAADDDKDAA